MSSANLLTATSAIEQRLTSVRSRLIQLPRPSLRTNTIVLALLLIAYNNVMYANNHWAFPPSWILYTRAIALPTVAVLVAIYVLGLTRREIGLDQNSPFRSLALGLGLAAIAAAPVALFLAFPIFVDDSHLRFSNIDGASDSIWGALYWAFLLYPAHTVIFEEILIRGVLQGLAIKAFEFQRGLAITAATFAFWHVATDLHVLGKAGVADNLLLFVPVQIFVLAALFASGLILGLLRERAGNLLTPMAVHWGFLVTLGAALYLATL